MTLNDFITESEAQAIKFSNLHYQKMIHDDTSGFTAVINSESILDKYFNIIQEYLYTIYLSDKELDEYKYNPKKLSFKLYNTTEYWFLILWANEMYSATQFDQKKIRLIRKGAIQSLLSEIRSVDKIYINESAAELISDTKAYSTN